MGLMFRRRRPLARLAVGAATAGVAYHAGTRRVQRDEYGQQGPQAYQATQDMAAPPPQYAPPPPRYARPQQYASPPVPQAAASAVDQLSALAELHDAGALTDEEFAAAKSDLLGL
jgi:hypothetical protein